MGQLKLSKSDFQVALISYSSGRCKIHAELLHVVQDACGVVPGLARTFLD